MSLPDGVERRPIEGRTRLATRGPAVYGEDTDGPWRAWDVTRSKLGALFEFGTELPLVGGETTLYLGAAAGTTVSHVADFAGPTYAVEFAGTPMQKLIEVAADRDRLFPLMKDARKPAEYAHVVEAECDLLIQDVATKGQATVANRNRQFLAQDGTLIALIKARSEDVTADPSVVFEDVCEELASEYEITNRITLEPYHKDHLAVVATPL